MRGRRTSSIHNQKKLHTLNRIFLGINELSIDEIEGWLDFYRYGNENKPLGPHGRNNYISALKWYLSRSKIIKFDQGILNALKKEPIKPKDRSFDEEALEHLLQFSPSTLHELAFRLIRECGLRPHELLSIKVSDVSETDEGWALIELPENNPETSSGRNKTGSRRIICVDNARRLLDTVENNTNNKDQGARLFPWSSGTLSVIFCRMKKKQKKMAAKEGWAKLYCGRLYDLRHASITEM
ncbi:MAG: tyrosine-type recombinase/integrase, partial [Candidatus Lokiarchaeota archaeon]|nr:tyrosine-type recombinase/integrase [Candidatus Lokiarchaeota archaeon]